MSEEEEESSYTVSVRFKEGIEKVSPEELRLIEANLPELLKLMLEDMEVPEE